MNIRDMVSNALVNRGYDVEKIAARKAMVAGQLGELLYGVPSNAPVYPSVGDYLITNNFDEACLYVLVPNDALQRNEWYLVAGSDNAEKSFLLLKRKYDYESRNMYKPAYRAISTVVTDVERILWEDN